MYLLFILYSWLSDRVKHVFLAGQKHILIALYFESMYAKDQLKILHLVNYKVE